MEENLNPGSVEHLLSWIICTVSSHCAVAIMCHLPMVQSVISIYKRTTVVWPGLCRVLMIFHLNSILKPWLTMTSQCKVTLAFIRQGSVMSYIHPQHKFFINELKELVVSWSDVVSNDYYLLLRTMPPKMAELSHRKQITSSSREDTNVCFPTFVWFV